MAIENKQISWTLAAIDRASPVFRQAEESMGRMAGAWRSVAATVGVGFGVGFFVSMIKGSIDAADHLNDLGKALNLGAEELSGLSLLAKQSGTDLEGLAKGIGKTSVEIGKDPEKFRALGVTAKSNTEAFKQFADIFNSLTDVQQRNALSNAVFGKSYAEMASALSEGSQKIGETMEKGARLARITEEMKIESDRFNDKLAELTLTMQGSKNAMVGDMLPALNSIITAMTSAYQEGGKLHAMWVALGGLGAVLFTDEFASNAVKFQNLVKELNALLDVRKANETQSPMERLFGISDLPEIEAKIAQTKARISALLKSMERVPQPPAPDADPAAAAKAAAFLKAGKEEADALAETNKFAGALQQLDEKLGRLNKTTEEENTLYKVLKGTLRGLTEDHKVMLLNKSVEIDLKNKDAAVTKSLLDYFADLEAKKKELAVAIAAEDKVRGDAISTAGKAIEQIKFETTLRGMSNLGRETAIALRNIELSGIKKETDAYEQLAGPMREALAGKHIAEAGQNVASELTEFWKKAAQEMQQSMSGLFFDVMQGRLSDLSGSFKTAIDRMVAEMLAAKAATALFGPGFGKGGQIGGWIGQGLSLLGIGGGASSLLDAAGNTGLGFTGYATGGSFTVGGRGGTDSQPVRFMATPGERVIVQTPAQQSSSDARLPPIVQNFHFAAPTDNRTMLQIGVAAHEGLMRARRNL